MSDNGNQNLFHFSENAINHLKKPELMKKIFEFKGRVIVDVDIHGLRDEIKNLSETVTRLLDKHEQLDSELLLYKKVIKHLEEKVVKHEKAQAMSVQYSRGTILNWREFQTRLEKIIQKKLLSAFVRSMELTFHQWILKHSISFLSVMSKLPKTLTNVTEL